MTVGEDKHPGRQRGELRDFLRTRRARISPDDAGIVGGGRRRTPGLRREEVAVLAGVGVSWYTWLEQGRDISVSSSVLDAVARALRLDDDERIHLYQLCGLNPPQLMTRSRNLELARLRRIVDGWLPNPAYVIDVYGNVHASNWRATSVFNVSDEGYNCPLTFFSDARVRQWYPEWDEIARRMVAQLRTQAVTLLDDPEFTLLVKRLHEASPVFAELWSRHEIDSSYAGVLVFQHPIQGRLVFEQTALTLAEHPDLRLMVYLTLPDSGKTTLARSANRPVATVAGRQAA